MVGMNRERKWSPVREERSSKTVVPYYFDTKDWFHERQVFNGPGQGEWF